MNRFFHLIACFLMSMTFTQAQISLDNGKYFDWANTYDFLDNDLNFYVLTITGYEGEFTAELKYMEVLDDLEPIYVLKCNVVPEANYRMLTIQFDEVASGKFPQEEEMKEVLKLSKNFPSLMVLSVDGKGKITTELNELKITGESNYKDQNIFEAREK